MVIKTVFSIARALSLFLIPWINQQHDETKKTKNAYLEYDVLRAIVMPPVTPVIVPTQPNIMLFQRF